MNINSTELHINNPDAPLWDFRKHYWEQTRETLQYFEEERKKITNGVNIGGYFFHPLLYWHINYFKTAIPTPVKGRPGHVHNMIRTPVLDDNTLYIMENYKDAEAQSKGMILFGSRGFLKTTFLSSLMHWLSLTNPDSTCSVVGGSSDDLETLASTIQTSLDAVHPAFYIPRITTDWNSEVVFGIKEKNQKPIVHSRIAITNADPDKKSKSEAGAGRNPSGFIIDEALCENSDIETPNGLVKMKDLQVGDFVIGEDGENAEIYSKIDPGVVDTYKFKFNNGASIVSSENHRWKVSINPDMETFNTVTLAIIDTYKNDIDLYFPTLNGEPTKLIDIEYAGKRQVYCIGVRNSSETFVVGGGIVTKNCGKFQFQKVWESALPSFKTPHGYRLVPVLSGCVCADTMVWNNKGDLVKIQDLKQEEGIVGFNQELEEISKEGISYWQPPHEKPCYRITLRSGKTLECSDDHPILFKPRLETETVNGRRRRKVRFKEAKDLVAGEHVAVVESVNIWSDKEMWEPRLVGQLIGDGTYGNNHTPRICGCDDEMFDYIKGKFETVDLAIYETKGGKTYQEIRIKGICQELRKLGIYGQTKKNKRLPVNVHSYSKESVCKMLGGYFDADGYVSTTGNNKMIGVSSISLELIKEVQLLLQKLGIHAYITKKESKPTKLVPVSSTSHVLTVADKRSVLTFYENIKFSIKYKQDNLKKCVEKFQGHKEQIDRGYKGVRFEAIKTIEFIGEKPVYNLTADTTHTYIANGIITHNTGGNTSLSQYAKKVLSAPESYGLIPVNWELLERGVPKEAITWERSKKGTFGTFVPGQMSYRLEGEKLDSNMADFLEVKDEVLKNIPLKVTDWLQKTELIGKLTSDKKRDEDERNRDRMYYPIETADCFLTQSINPFPTKIIDRHIRYLEDMGKLGKNVDIIMEGSTPTISFCDRHRAEIHHKGGNIDAPIILHGDIPTTPPNKYLNVSGFDGYKLEDSDTDSLGSLYVIRRRHMEANSPCETILCSYTSRPNRMKDFHKECERVIEVFNSQCCMESVDMGLMQYLDQKSKAEDLLAPAFTFSNSANANSNLRSRFGLYPTKANNEFRFNLLVEFTKEEHTIGIDDQGNEIIKYGVEFLDDIDLLKELLNYYKGGNFDRITAFSHALVYARELDKQSVQPKPKKSLMPTPQQRPTNTRVNPYGNIRHKKY